MSGGDSNSRVRDGNLNATSNRDLLCVALTRHAIDVESNLAGVDQLLREIQDIRYLGSVGAARLNELFGLDEHESLRFLCAVELGRRIGKLESQKSTSKPLTDQEAAYEHLKEYAGLEQEVFVALYMDLKGNVLRKQEVHKGTADASLVRPADVLREAVKQGYPRLIVAHNHPSGDPEPSPEDIMVTRDLVRSAELLGIELVDHLIIGRTGKEQGKGYVSLKERGYI